MKTGTRRISVWLPVRASNRKTVFQGTFQDGKVRVMMRTKWTPGGKPCTVVIHLERAKSNGKGWKRWKTLIVTPSEHGATVS